MLNSSKIIVMPVAMAFIIFLLNAEMTIANLAVYELGQHFHVDMVDLQWVMSINILTLSATLIFSGNVIDAYGPERSLIAGLLLLLLASALAGLAPSFPVLLIGRLFQGVASSLLFASSMTLLFHVFPKDRKAVAQAYCGVALSVAIVFAPLLGGILLQYWGWRWIFLINVPIVSLAIVMFYFLMPKSIYPVTEKSIPFFKALLLMAALLCLLKMVSSLGEDTIMWWNVALFFVAATGLLFGYIWAELKGKVHLVDLHLLTHRACLFASLMRFLLHGLTFFYYLSIAIISEKVFMLTAMQTALTFVLPGIALGAAYLFGSALAMRFGYAAVLKPCCVCCLLGCLLLFSPIFNMNLIAIVAINSVMLFAVGMMNTSLTTYVLLQSHPSKVGSANGLVATFAFVGSAFTLALATIIMFHVSNYEVAAWVNAQSWVLPTDASVAVQHLASGGKLVEQQLSEVLSANQLTQIMQTLSQALFTGYRYAMLLFAGLAAIAFGLSIVVSRSINREKEA